ncbi:MAG TPA: hypothetical protein VFF05_02475, partial [Rudaea sp.]|nr:hypothetical protein [Rudaea sp.]
MGEIVDEPGAAAGVVNLPAPMNTGVASQSGRYRPESDSQRRAGGNAGERVQHHVPAANGKTNAAQAESRAHYFERDALRIDLHVRCGKRIGRIQAKCNRMGQSVENTPHARVVAVDHGPAGRAIGEIGKRGIEAFLAAVMRAVLAVDIGDDRQTRVVAGKIPECLAGLDDEMRAASDPRTFSRERRDVGAQRKARLGA